MPVWARVCVEENWHGGCESYEYTCDTTERSQVSTALSDVEDTTDVENWDLSGVEALRTCLRSKIGTIEIHCEGCSFAAYQSGNRVTMCTGTFSDTQDRINAVVFHELVHACGGTELDAEAFENHFYRLSGATAPCCGDFEKFRCDGGNFVNWNRTTGQVTVIGTGDVLNVNTASFVDPDPGASCDEDGWI